MAKKSVFDQDYWERKHKRQLNARARYVKQLFDDLARKVASLGIDINLPSEKEFRLEDYPALNKRINEMVREVAKKVTHNIEEGEEEAWLLSNAKNDALVDYVAQGVKLPKEVVSGWKNQNLLALSAFQKRKIAGMGLSERVWNLTQTAKQELELALDIGIGEGKSADELSRDIRQYLNEPNKLFRRVRDERGILRLSKAAKMYHPGRGVYRSSYKNALRLTQTETNMAYRSADHERWQQLSFVIGQRINLSNNHTLNGVPFYDICDELAGVYPKDFKFVGWHPKCRCYKTSELAKREERIEYLKKIANGEDVSDFKFSGQVKDMPDKFGTWLEKNAERIQRAEKRGTLPYFLRDNKKLFVRNEEGALALKPPKKTSLEVASETIKAQTNIEKAKSYWEVLVKDTATKEIMDVANKCDWEDLGKEMQSIFDNYGIKVAGKSVRIAGDRLRLEMNGDGFMLERTFLIKETKQLEVHHDLFELSKQMQGKGISKDIFRSLYKQYKNMGVDYISVFANLDVGGYTWARYGFCAKTKNDALLVIKTNKNISEQIKETAKKLVTDYYKENNISEFMPFPMDLIASQEWGKSVLLGSCWDGVLTMADKKAIKVFEQYLGL